MIRGKIECCDCATPSYPCRGNTCSNRHRQVLICDKCGEEVEKLYRTGDGELCEECLLGEYEVIE